MNERGLSVSIADDGPGFNNPKLAAAVDGLHDRDQARQGWGIALAQEIVTAYGGALTFQPGNDGGLAILICLP